jgi:RHS repeat-associated protein
VLSTVSDRRLAVSSGSVLAYYRADEKSYADYDPYGMLLPGRFGGGFADQKFGFQGQLKDDELNGSAGSSYAFEYRVHDPRVGRFFSVDPLSSQQPWYSPYNFAGNNPVACIDYKGGRPIYGPGWSMGTLMLSHTNFFAVLVESNNSSPLLMHKYATGAEHTNAQRRAWHYSLVGSMGEAIVGENALWNFGLHGMFHGHNTFPYIRYGVYYGGAPVDIAITCNTGTRRRLWSNALSERTFVMMPTYDPVTWEKTGDAEYGSQNGVEQRWTILVEVKTLNPEGDAETIFYELSEGMQQLDRSISAAGERSIAWLQTDTDTWKRVMSDSTYGPKLRQAYNSYLAKGNRHIKLVDDLYNDAVNQLNEAQKDIQNANPTGN